MLIYEVAQSSTSIIVRLLWILQKMFITKIATKIIGEYTEFRMRKTKVIF